MLYSKIEGTGKPLLILHGFLGMSDNWKTLGVEFAKNNFEVHLLDLRNHGRSFHSNVFTYDAMMQDIHEYCIEKKLKSIMILGHSMGGKVAMNFACTFPEMIEKLIVADIGPKYYQPHHQEILKGLSAVDFTEKPDREAVDEILKNYIPDFGTRQFLMKSLYWKESGQLAFRFNLAVFEKEIENIGTALKQNQIYVGPTLFIRGGKSNYIKEEDIAEISKHFPNMKLETIHNVGHWLHAENPTLFYQKVMAFVQ